MKLKLKTENKGGEGRGDIPERIGAACGVRRVAYSSLLLRNTS